MPAIEPVTCADAEPAASIAASKPGMIQLRNPDNLRPPREETNPCFYSTTPTK